MKGKIFYLLSKFENYELNGDVYFTAKAVLFGESFKRFQVCHDLKFYFKKKQVYLLKLQLISLEKNGLAKVKLLALRDLKLNLDELNL